MKKVFLPLFIVVIVIGMVLTALHKNSSDIPPLTTLKERYSLKSKPSVDHLLFPEAQEEIQNTSRSNRSLHLLS